MGALRMSSGALLFRVVPIGFAPWCVPSGRAPKEHEGRGVWGRGKALRSPAVAPHSQDYFRYLRLLLSALQKLPFSTNMLYRGVALDLSGEYPKGSEARSLLVAALAPHG